MLPQTVHPTDKAEFFSQLRIHPHELTQAHLLPFVPNAAQLDQSDPITQRRIDSLRKIIAHCSTVQAAATYILEHEEWDFVAVYFDAIDHFCHGFMKFHPPRREHIPEDVYEMYKDVVVGGYRYHDMMLGRLLELAGEDATILLISDHGFHPGHLRPRKLPHEPAGPAVEHSPYGIFVARGPDIRQDERIYGASLLDITPTILSLFNLPVAKDMDGKVLSHIFNAPPKLDVIPSWENVPGMAGMHPDDLRDDPYAAQQALQQLIDLGYIEAPGADMEKAIQRTTNENNFYLARSYLQASQYTEAITILQRLFDENPTVSRYGQYLVNACLQARRIPEARAAVQRLREQQKQETPGLLLLMGLVVLSEQKALQALDYFRQAVAFEAELPSINLHIGQCFQILGRWEEAKTAFQKALDTDPENERAWHGLGLAHLRTEDYEPAVEYLLQSIGLLYHQPFVHYHLGEALYQLSEYQHSAEAFQVSLHIMPGLNKARNWLARIYRDHLDQPARADALQEELLQHTQQEILIVSGLPRSGTSMMMQMLHAGGISPFTDAIRTADADNPKGYYEHEAVKALIRDQRFLEEVDGEAVKVIANLLFHLPDRYRYRIIFMERDLDEVLRSQQTMLARQGKTTSDTIPLTLLENFNTTIKKIKNSLGKKANIELFFVSYTDVLTNPTKQATALAQFIGKDLAIQKMAAVVDNSLYRQRKS